MKFLIKCKVCSQNMKIQPCAELEPMIARCGECGARHYVNLESDRLSLQYLGNLEPNSQPAIEAAWSVFV